MSPRAQHYIRNHANNFTCRSLLVMTHFGSGLSRLQKGLWMILYIKSSPKINENTQGHTYQGDTCLCVPNESIQMKSFQHRIMHFSFRPKGFSLERIMIKCKSDYFEGIPKYNHGALSLNWVTWQLNFSSYVDFKSPPLSLFQWQWTRRSLTCSVLSYLWFCWWPLMFSSPKMLCFYNSKY